MRLRPGQEIVLSWPAGAADCHVVAAAGEFVLLKPGRTNAFSYELPDACTLTFLDGMIPMGIDGRVEFGAAPGELRFRVSDASGAERRSAVRLPLFAEVHVSDGGRELRGQVLDVSAGGLRFRGTGQHDRGGLLRIHLQLPGGPTLDATGIVRSSDLSGVTAVEFTAFHVGSAQEVGAWTVGQLRQSLARA